MTQERIAAPTPEGRIKEAIGSILEPLRRYGRGHVEFRDPDYTLLICTPQYAWNPNHSDLPSPLGYQSFLVFRGTPQLDTHPEVLFNIPDVNPDNLTEYAALESEDGGDLTIYSPGHLQTLVTEFGTVISIFREEWWYWTREGFLIVNPEEKAQYLENIAKAIKSTRYGSVPT